VEEKQKSHCMLGAGRRESGKRATAISKALILQW